MATELRRAGYNVENYLEPAKLDKQFKYADKARIPVALLIGPDEKAKGTIILKDLAKKTQTEVPHQELLATLAPFFQPSA